MGQDGGGGETDRQTDRERETERERQLAGNRRLLGTPPSGPPPIGWSGLAMSAGGTGHTLPSSLGDG